jgi:hypothetical protein
MRKLVFAISFLVSLLSVNCFGKEKITVREIYYQVSEDGEVNDRKTIQDLNIEYNLNRGATKISNNKWLGNSSYIPNVDLYDLRKISNRSDKQTLVYDDNKRLIECTEHKDNSSTIKCYISYNQYDDPAEIKYVLENSDGTSSDIQTITIEYFYFCDVPSLKPTEKDIKRYYKFGIIPSEQGCNWMLRTVKKDGIIVQHAERKYYNN